MDIAVCRAEDIGPLERHLPSYAVGHRHTDRYARQVKGDSSYLIPWLDGRPVGHAEVRWTGCEAPEVRAAHPGCPDIISLFVWPESLRSHGIGTALIRAAERLALERGIEAMGLGVRDDNTRAAALYARLGYRPTVPYTDRWTYHDEEGVQHERVDLCTFLVGQLP